MNTDDDPSHLLGKLGILHSTIRSPKRQVHVRMAKQRSALNEDKPATSNSSVKKMNPKREGSTSKERDLLASVSESSPSSDDDDPLFDRMGASHAGNSQKRLRFRGASNRRGWQATGEGADVIDYSRWKFICLACSFLLIGLSSAICRQMIIGDEMAAGLYLHPGEISEPQSGSAGATTPSETTTSSGVTQAVWSEWTNRWLHFSFAQMLGCLLGIYAVAPLFTRLNPFVVLLTLMLIAMLPTLLCLDGEEGCHRRKGEPVPSSSISPNSYLHGNWLFFALQAFAIGGIERVGLLYTHSRKGGQTRWMFAIYALMALASLFGGSVVHDGELQRVRGGARNAGMQDTPEITHLSIGVLAPGHVSLFKRDVGAVGEPTHDSSNHSTSLDPGQVINNVTEPKPTTIATPPTKGATSKQEAEAPVFKTKTEENAFKRKEVEEKHLQEEEAAKKKSEEKSKETRPTATTKSTATALTTTTTTVVTTTLPPVTSTTSTTTAAPTTTTPPAPSPVLHGENHQQGTNLPKEEGMGVQTFANTAMSNGEKNVKEEKHVLSSQNETSNSRNASRYSRIDSATHIDVVQIVLLLSVLLLPLVFGLSCCFLGSPFKAEATAVQAIRTTAAEGEIKMPCGCCCLSSLLFILHSALESIPLFLFPVTAHYVQQHGSSTATLGRESAEELSSLVGGIYWGLTAVTRAIFILRPSSAVSARTIHYCYAMAMALVLASLVFAPAKGDLLNLLISGITGFFISSVPLLLYSWQFAQLQMPPLALTKRLLGSTAIGKLVLPVGVAIWGSSGPMTWDGSTGRNTVVCLLAVCYAIFIALSTTLGKVKRRQEISTLCGDLNGRTRTGKRQVAATTTSKQNGKYKSLLSEDAQREADSSSTETDIDLEMSEPGVAEGLIV